MGKERERFCSVCVDVGLEILGFVAFFFSFSFSFFHFSFFIFHRVFEGEERRGEERGRFEGFLV